MIAAANAAGKQLMIAHCIRFWPEYAWVKQAVESGNFGRVIAADFSRLSAAPAWANDSWLADPAKSGGIALDLHIHDLDFIQYLFGKPVSIRSTGTAHVHSQVDYGDGRVITATASWSMPSSFGFKMGFKIIFENAAVVFDESELRVYPSEGDPFTPDVGDGDGYKGEVEYFAELIAGANKETVITPEQARESVRMALESITS